MGAIPVAFVMTIFHMSMMFFFYKKYQFFLLFYQIFVIMLNSRDIPISIRILWRLIYI